MNRVERWIAHVVLLRRLVTGATLIYLACALCIGSLKEAKPVCWLLILAWTSILIWARLRCGREACLWANRLPSANWQRAMHWIDILAWNLCCSFILCELALRAAALCTGNSPLLLDTVDAYRLVPGRVYGKGVRGNHLGFPGPDFQVAKAPGKSRIAVLGDSFAVGPTVAYDDNFLHLAEHEQENVEIYNFGISGTGPREYLATLRQHVFAFHPDLVLACIFVGNDITEIMATPRHLDIRKNYSFLFLSRAWRLLKNKEQRGYQQSEPSSQAGGLSRQSFIEIESRRLAVCYSPVPETIEKKWRIALAHLQGIVEECGARQVKLGVVLIPDQFQVEPDVLKAALEYDHRPPSAVQVSLPQQRLCEFFADRQVPCLDLLPSMVGKTCCYTPNDTHWNEKGNRLAGECLVCWLAEEFGHKRRMALALKPSPSRQPPQAP
jgi:hypothetical protein